MKKQENVNMSNKNISFEYDADAERPENQPTWEMILNGPNYYEDCVTLDPGEIEESMKILHQNTTLLQIAALPAIAFFALNDTLETYFGKGVTKNEG